MKRIDSWFKNSTVRNYTCKNAGSEKVIVSDEMIDICFLKKCYKSSSNLIALPGYDVVRLNDISLLDNLLEHIKLLTSAHTVVLAPFQVIYSPRIHGILAQNENIIFRNDSFEIDCSQTLEKLIAAVSKRKRAEVKSYITSGINFKVNDVSAKRCFYDFYAHSMKSLNFTAGSIFSAEQVNDFIQMKSTYVISAELNGETMLAHLVGVDEGKKRAEFILSGFKCDSGREVSAKLIWFSINYLKSIGVESYHLGGGVSPGDGLENFKRQLGGQRLTNFFIKIINDKELYDHCVGLAPKGINIENRFPSYLY